MKIYLLFIFVMTLLFTSCWDETDSITFSKDGSIKFESQIYINDTTLQVSAINEWMKNYMNELSDAKWNVHYEYISQSFPIQIKVSGKGNINSIADSTGFYSFQKVSKKKYEFLFYKSMFQTSSDRRIINLTKNSIALKTIDGTEIKTISMDGYNDEKTVNSTYILDLN